ncbi:MAG: phage tail tape measure protein [Candidatus Paceibacterota bacterium]
MPEKIGLIAIFDTSQFNKGLNDYLGGVGKATDATNKASDGAFSWTRALEVAVGNALVEVGKLALEAGKAIYNFGAESVTMATDFQTSMVELRNAAGDSGLSIDDLGNLALRVGGDTKVLGASATGAADAMINLYKAGLQDNAIFGDMQGYLAGTADLGGLLKASFDLAAASELDVAQASELGVVALSIFGNELETDAEKGQFAADSLDNIVKAANASNASVSDISAALAYAGPNAAAFGVSLEDTNVALALLSNAGIKGSMAGTTLSAIMRDLKKETKESAAAWDEMGISIYDAEGATRPFIDIIGDLEVAMEGKTQQQKDAILQDIFTAEGMRGINTILQEGTEGWNEMAGAIDGATGLQEQAAAKSATFAGQMEALKGQLETFQIMLGSAFLPALTSLAQAFMPLAEAAMPAITIAFQNLSAVLTKLVGGFITLTQGGFAEGIGTIGSVIGSVFGEQAQTVFTNVAIFLRENIPDAIEIFKSAWSEGTAFIGTIIETLKAFFATIAPSLQAGVDQWVNLFNSFMTNVDTIWAGIKSIIQGAIDIILGIVTVFISAFSGDWSALWVGVQQILSGAWQLITGIVTAALGLIMTVVGTNFEKLSTTVSQLWTIIKVKTSAAWEAIKTAVSEAAEAVKTKAQAMYDDVVSFFSSLPAKMSEIGGNIITGLVNGITSASGAVADALNSVIEGAIAGAKAALGIHSPSRVFMEIGANTMMGMAQGVSAASGVPQSAMLSAVGGMVSTVGNTTNNYNNSRNIELNITNQGQNSGNRTYFDVVAGLQAVGV